MNWTSRFCGLVFLTIVSCTTNSFAQEVYFSISGQKAKVESGEKAGLNDIWIRPKSLDAVFPNPEVYDAGIGGYADVIQGEANTVTEFSIIDFDSVYVLGKGSILPAKKVGAKSISVNVTGEMLYKNRWISLFTYDGTSKNGWILRVETNEGDDVNDFKVRLPAAMENDYDIVSLDLSIGLYKTSTEQTVQLKPLFSDSAPSFFTVTGQEDSDIHINDAFGEIIKDSIDWKSEKFGIPNTWVLTVNGSKQRLNNLVVSGNKGIIPWIIKPVIVKNDKLQPALFRTQALESCEDVQLELLNRGFEYDVNRTIWQTEKKTYSGNTIRHQFVEKGNIPVRIIIPLKGRYAPLYQVTESTVFINKPPVIKLNEYKTLLSPAENLLLDATASFDPEGKTLEFAWFTDDIFRTSDAQFRFNSSTSGEYRIRLLINDLETGSACTTADTTILVRVNTQPYVEIKLQDIVAQGSSSSFSAISSFDSDNDNLAYSWKIEGLVGDGKQSEVSADHKTNGLYKAELTVDDQTNTTNSSYTITKNYKVNGAPKPQFTIPKLAAPNQKINLSASNSTDPDSDKLVYSWSISDGRTSNTENWLISFNESGDYLIKLTVDDSMKVENSNQSIEFPIHINFEPVPEITVVDKSNSAIISLSAVNSTDQDHSIVDYSWDFGDGTKGNGLDLIHEYPGSGVYIIELFVNDGKGMSNSIISTKKMITINNNPVAAFSFPKTVAPGVEFTLDASSTKDSDGKVVSYEWFFLDSRIDTVIKPKYSFEKPGDYAIRLKVKDNSGFDDAIDIISHSIHVNYPPIPRWDATPKVVSPDQEIVLSATNSSDEDNKNLSFEWKFENEEKLESGLEIKRKFAKAGTYFFTLTADDGRGLANSKQSVKGTIRINARPIPVSEKKLVVNQLSVVLDASKSYDADGAIKTFTWVLPDGSKRNEPIFTWNAPNGGYHKVGLTIDDGEGLKNSKASMGVDIFMNRPVSAQLDSLIESCTGQLIIFSSARCFDPDGDQFTTEWDFGDGSTSKESNPYHTYKTPGLYFVTLKLSDGIADNPTVAQIPVVISGSPTAFMNFADTTICVNSPLLFDGSSSTDPNGPIGAYSWNFGDETSGVGKNLTHLYTKSGLYTVRLTVVGSSTGVCSNTSQVSATVRVIEGPNAEFTVSEWINHGEMIQLDCSTSRYDGKLASVKWSVYDGENTIVQSLEGIKTSFKAETPGEYRIVLDLIVESSSACNQSSMEKTIRINYPPELVWNTKTLYPVKKPIRLSAVGSKDADGFISSYQWVLDGKKSSSQLELFIPELNAGKHSVELILKDNSKIKSGTISKKLEFEVKEAPFMAVKVPDKIHSGETISLKAQTANYENSGTLKTEWFLNNQLLTKPEFKATEPVYKVKLIKDNGLGLSNSRDSLELNLAVNQAPKAEIELPKVIIQNGELKASDFSLPKDVYLVQFGKKISVWTAKDSGKQTVEFAWMPKDSVLKIYSYEIEVLPKLNAENPSSDIEIKWNPANPYVQVEAPKMNRPEGTPLVYEWFLNGKLSASGNVVMIPVNRGRQDLELRVSEFGIAQSKPFSKKINLNVN